MLKYSALDTLSDPTATQLETIRRGSALKLCGRIWNVSAEDMAVPACCDILPNIAIAAAMSVIVSLDPFDTVPDAKRKNELESYVWGSLLLHFALIAVNLLLLFSSCKTQMFSSNLRIVYLVYLRIIALVFQIVRFVLFQVGVKTRQIWALYGIFAVRPVVQAEQFEDGNLVVPVFNCTVSFNSISTLMFFIFTCCAYHTFGNESYDSNGTTSLSVLCLRN
jgi:hypothetical protein